MLVESSPLLISLNEGSNACNVFAYLLPSLQLCYCIVTFRQDIQESRRTIALSKILRYTTK